MREPRFVAVGELLVDVVADGSGHEARILVRAGGSASNAATVAARLGARSAVVGTVGTDAAGGLVLGELSARGVDTAGVRRVDGSTGTFLLANGEVLVDRGVSPDVVLPDRFEGDAVLVSGYLAPETIAAALGAARAWWVALDAARLDALPPGGNAVMANEEAARRLTGLEPEQAARRLAESYRLACVTRGAAGAVAVLDGRLERVRAVGPVGSEQPGAGDAFAAALLVSLARGADLAAALAEAAREGAAAATWQ